jgi:hypothetical protein
MNSKELRRRAVECLEMARTSSDLFVKVALGELAEEFDAAATEAEERAPVRNDRASNKRVSVRLRTTEARGGSDAPRAYRAPART